MMKRSRLQSQKEYKNTKISDFFPKIDKKSIAAKEQNQPKVLSPNLHRNKRRCFEISSYTDPNKTLLGSPAKDSNGGEFMDLNKFLDCEVAESDTELDYVNKENVVEISDDESSDKVTNYSKENKLSPEKYISPQKLNTPTKNTSNNKTHHKSPKRLDCFDVEVLPNTAKITPSKRNKVVTPGKNKARSSEKKQSSLLKFISPSQKSATAKTVNESTPTKMSSPKKETPSKVKVKTKLNFGSPRTTKNSTPPKSLRNFEESNSNILEDSWDGSSWDLPTEDDFDLNLTETQMCKVLEIRESKDALVIVLESIKTKKKALCNLEGYWRHLKLNCGNTIHVTATKDASSQWAVTNENGLVVYEPHILVSGSTISNSLFCKRRSVLAELYSEPSQDNRLMVIGSLVHKLLQNALQTKAWEENMMEDILQSLLKSKDTLRTLYTTSLTTNELELELRQFIPRIVEFVAQYITKSQHPTVANWKGSIDEIQDIEENFWCSDLGIKGRIDVSVRVGNSTMPLELKTGRATVSLEHRAQVMLYILMMSKFGYKVDSGLLLYLREGILREVPMTHREKRDIVMLRNDLVFYLKNASCMVYKELDSNKLESVDDLIQNSHVKIELPEPISHKSCKNCSYNTVCTSYLNLEGYDLTKATVLQEVYENVKKKLKNEHLDYFFEWNLMLLMEDTCSKKDRKNVKDIFTLSPEVREKGGKCIADTSIVATKEQNGMHLVTFKKTPENSSFNFNTTKIGENSYVVISTEKRPAVGTGFVASLNVNSIDVTIDRDLNSKYPKTKFHIDTYDFANSYIYNMTNLTLLLEDSEQADRLRKFIIDKKKPTFREKLPRNVATKGAPILQKLNRVQQRAVLRALSANDFLLIKGMPGTGKTSTIVALIQLLMKLDETVLITSHTHSAVDNVCIRLQKNGVNVLRLGSSARINPELASASEYELTKNCVTTEELEAVYNSASIVAVTCLGSGHPLLGKRTFDVCIVDESTQVLQPTVLRSLYAAKKFVLIGDTDQLPPVVRSKDALARGMSVSIFERLEDDDTMVSLNINYRMNQPITDLANKLTYKGELLIANEITANWRIDLPKLEELLCDYDPWVNGALDSSLDGAVKFLDTGPVWKFQSNLDSSRFQVKENACANIFETMVVSILVRILLKAGLPSSSLGVIAPYRAHVEQMSAALEELNIDVNTVDQFQGRDKEVIIFSCTKSIDPNGSITINKFDILEDRRRLNVAITRAKRKLIIVGDISSVKLYTPFAKVVQSLKEDNLVKICTDQIGFDRVVSLFNKL